MFFFLAFQLTVKSLKSQVYSLLKGVGHFVGHQLFLTVGNRFYHNLLIERSFWFHYLQGEVKGGERGITTRQFICFLDDETIQFLGDVEMDGLNSYVHN